MREGRKRERKSLIGVTGVMHLKSVIAEGMRRGRLVQTETGERKAPTSWPETKEDDKEAGPTPRSLIQRKIEKREDIRRKDRIEIDANDTPPIRGQGQIGTAAKMNGRGETETATLIRPVKGQDRVKLAKGVATVNSEAVKVMWTMNIQTGTGVKKMIVETGEIRTTGIERLTTRVGEIKTIMIETRGDIGKNNDDTMIERKTGRTFAVLPERAMIDLADGVNLICIFYFVFSVAD